MKFSIIVPVYNVKEYLRECVESILSQTFSDYELLLIDDGSTDGSGKICDVYAQYNPSIKVVHRKNGGLSAARNTGIENASGDYFVFIDSDDYIKIESLQKISECIGSESYDVIVTRLIQKYSDSEDIRNESICSLLSENSEQIVQWIFRKSENTWPAVQYIVSKKYVQEHSFRFEEGFLHEDMAWTACLLSLAQNVTICSFPWYYHRMQRTDSITSTSNPKRVVDVLALASNTIKFMKQQNISENKQTMIADRIFSSISSILSQYKEADREGKMIQRALSEHIKMFRNFSSIQGEAFYLATKYFGIKCTISCFTFVQYIIHKMKRGSI